MVQRRTYRRRHSYATKSNQHRLFKTPVYQTIKERASDPKCPITGKRIQGNDPANFDADPNTNAEKAQEKDFVIEKLFQFENEQSSPDLVPRANWSAEAVPSGLFPESIDEELVKQEGPAVEYHCNSCSADCSRKRYHCLKQAEFL